LVGYSFMGATHSHAWRTAPRFFDLPLAPELTALAGRNPNGVRAAASKFGWDSVHTDWSELVERDDIDVIDICSPGNTHAEIAIAALEAGKHVLCEKPLANTVAEAERMTSAAEAAAARGVYSMCGFTYRRTPALALARRMVDEGRLGPIRHVRAQYLQDWLSDADAPLTWRLDKAKSGSGSLGDIGAQHRCRPMDHGTLHHRRIGAAGDLREATAHRRGLRWARWARRCRRPQGTRDR
jgi:predicted dehydrogenase